MAKYDFNTVSLSTLLEDPEVVAILEKHSPGVTSNPMLGMVQGMPASQVMGMASGMIGADTVAAIRAEVEAL